MTTGTQGITMPEKERYNHAQTEAELQALWQNNKVYSFDPVSKKPLFSIDTPPPTVSGSLHIGHIFSYTHTDIIARFKRMRGFNVFYPMGFDDNGLPTERFVEKKLGIKGHLMKRSEFIKLCLQESHAVEKTFEELWKKMGLSIDWKLVYSTISNDARKVSQHSFLDLYKKNKVERKVEPSLYCTTCQTSVAQAELDSAEVNTNFNTIQFSTTMGEKLNIATTRPELLGACVAVFYNPEDPRYTHLKGATAITPYYKKEVPLLADAAVQIDKGTGLVMCCTFGDATDIAWFKEHKLPVLLAVGRNGKWTSLTGPLEGMNAHDARKKMIELLREEETLLEQKQISHNVHTHERCKQEIEYLILHQWFVRILDHKEDFLRMGDQINWHPEFMQSRYNDWVSNLGWDWCISRQRFFGIPFPLWHCQDCQQILVAEAKDLPIDPQETPYPGKVCTNCKSSNIVGETDVMDTWNTSSVTPEINAGWPEQNKVQLPMSMRPQAHDIIRTWAFDTIVKSFYHHGRIPWKDIVISGHVLAGGKEKISKSKDNSSTAPETLMAAYAADAIRYWTANGKLGMDTAFSDNQLKMGNRLVTKLWNAFKFSKPHTQAHIKTTTIPKLDALNEWILDHVRSTMEKVIAHYESYEYHAALEVAERFFWHNFCDNYVELIKDQFFNPEKYSQETLAGTRYALYEVGFAILQMYAPVLCHITEHLYLEHYQTQEQETSIHTTIISNERYAQHIYPKNTALFDSLILAISHARKLKSEQHLSLKVPVATLTVLVKTEELKVALTDHATLLKGICHAEELLFELSEQELQSLEKTDDKLYMKITV